MGIYFGEGKWWELGGGTVKIYENDYGPSQTAAFYTQLTELEDSKGEVRGTFSAVAKCMFANGLQKLFFCLLFRFLLNLRQNISVSIS